MNGKSGVMGHSSLNRSPKYSQNRSPRHYKSPGRPSRSDIRFSREVTLIDSREDDSNVFKPLRSREPSPYLDGARKDYPHHYIKRTDAGQRHDVSDSWLDLGEEFIASTVGSNFKLNKSRNYEQKSYGLEVFKVSVGVDRKKYEFKCSLLVNGANADFILDTGSEVTVLTTHAARCLGLDLSETTRDFMGTLQS